MHLEVSMRPIMNVVFERGRNRTKSEIVPGDFLETEPTGFERFRTGIELRPQGFCQKINVDLIDLRDVLEIKVYAPMTSWVFMLNPHQR